MTRAVLVAALVGLGACADAPDDPAAGPRTVHPAPGLEADASARAMTATDPESVDAATGRLLAYIGAHAEGAEAADTLWSTSGVPEGADVSAEPFRRPGRRVVGATVDAPSEPEGAAGSVYVDVPLTLVTRTDEGTTETLRLRYTLRRANGVPGADPADARWHIDSVAAE